MHQTPKSKLKILSQQSQPKIPQIFLSRQKHKPINRNILQSDSKQSYQAKEVIIDAKKYNNHSNLSRQRSKRSLRHSQGIRAEIDICLNAIQNVYEEERNKKNMINRRSNIEEQKGSVACNNSIHRVDSNIILEYIHTIEKEYGVPNYFQQNEEFILALQQKMQGFSLKNPQSRYNSDMKKRKGSPKTFLSLTLSQARAKRSNSTTKEKEISQKKQVNLTHYPSTGNFPTINHFDLKQHHSIRQKIDLNNKPEIKILDEYKYCINCQQKILISNINFHEKNQCTNLQQLYKMDYKSLKEFVHNKIVKIKGFILISLATFQRNAQIKQTIRQKELQFLDQMHLFLKSLENIQTNKLQYSQTKAHFNKLLNLPKNFSLNLLIQAQKLNWFVNIYCQICHHQNKQQSSISQIIKNETIKNGLHHKDKQYNSNVIQLKSIQQFSQKQT